MKKYLSIFLAIYSICPMLCASDTKKDARKSLMGKALRLHLSDITQDPSKMSAQPDQIVAAMKALFPKGVNEKIDSDLFDSYTSPLLELVIGKASLNELARRLLQDNEIILSDDTIRTAMNASNTSIMPDVLAHKNCNVSTPVLTFYLRDSFKKRTTYMDKAIVCAFLKAGANPFVLEPTQYPWKKPSAYGLVQAEITTIKEEENTSTPPKELSYLEKIAHVFACHLKQNPRLGLYFENEKELPPAKILSEFLPSELGGCMTSHTVTACPECLTSVASDTDNTTAGLNEKGLRFLQTVALSSALTKAFTDDKKTAHAVLQHPTAFLLPRDLLNKLLLKTSAGVSADLEIAKRLLNAGANPWETVTLEKNEKTTCWDKAEELAKKAPSSTCYTELQALCISALRKNPELSADVQIPEKIVRSFIEDALLCGKTDS